MKVDVQDISSVEKRIVVEVPADKVKKERSSLYRLYRQRVKIRGFRPGKAPLEMIKRFYGEAIEQEVVSNLVQNTLPDALKESGLHPVSEPSLDELPSEVTAELSYAVKFEVKPELGDLVLDDISVDYPPVEIEESAIQDELKYLRYQNANYEPKEGTADIGDFATVEFEAKLDGKTVIGPVTRPTELGQGMSFPELSGPLAGLDDELVGLAAETPKEFELTLSDELQDEELRGKTISCTALIKELKRIILPELDDEFAKDLGEFDTLADLQTKIRERLVNHKESMVRRDVEKALMEQVIAKNPFDVPHSLVAKQMDYLRRQKEMQFMMSGIDPRANPELLEPLLAGLSDEATSSVQTMLLLEKIANMQGIEVDEPAINDKLESMAQSSGQHVAKIRARYAPGTSERDSLAFGIKQDRALEWLMGESVKGLPKAEAAADDDAKAAEESAAPESEEPVVASDDNPASEAEEKAAE